MLIMQNYNLLTTWRSAISHIVVKDKKTYMDVKNFTELGIEIQDTSEGTTWNLI